MPVIIDTSVWSLAYRRRKERLAPPELRVVTVLGELIAAAEIVMLGLIRQELLSGIRDAAQFEKILSAVGEWPDEPVEAADHIHAARCSNQLRANGITTTTVDVFICAVALRLDVEIFSIDPDFKHYANFLPIRILDHFA